MRSLERGGSTLEKGLEKGWKPLEKGRSFGKGYFGARDTQYNDDNRTVTARTAPTGRLTIPAQLFICSFVMPFVLVH